MSVGQGLTRRIGVFSLDLRLVDQMHHSVMLVMAECAIVRAEIRWDTMRVWYMAISHQFRPIPEGYIAHEYTWNVSIDRFGTRFARATEMENRTIEQGLWR